jgi:hypothetical protein
LYCAEAVSFGAVANCQLFVRLWYRVSDVLDLSLVSKWFGFWPHITHVIVLTFKEIKHLSDYRTVGLSDCRIIGRTPFRSRSNLFSSRLGVARFSKCIFQASIILFWLYSTLSMTSVSVFIAELLLCILSNLWNVLLSSWDASIISEISLSFFEAYACRCTWRNVVFSLSYPFFRFQCYCTKIS